MEGYFTDKLYETFRSSRLYMKAIFKIPPPVKFQRVVGPLFSGKLRIYLMFREFFSVVRCLVLSENTRDSFVHGLFLLRKDGK